MQRLWSPVFSIALIVTIGFASLMPAPVSAQNRLAPGVLKTIPSDLDPRDSFSLPMPMPGIEVAEYEPKFLSKKDTLHNLAQRVIMFRDVWEYEFSFVGQVRQAKFTVPDLKTGILKTKNVWYLIYRIRDLGNTLTYDQVQQNPDFEHIMFELKRDQPIPNEKKFFLPRFTLEGSIITNARDGYEKISYPDKISPMVLRQIQRREDPDTNLLNSIEMSQAKIPIAKTDADGGVWGVAVFEDVDPRIDYVSVYVNGLTNAFRINENPEQPNRMKTLQLNFWRPGDIVDEASDRIEYGIPLVDNPQQQVLIAERYDLPGPLIRCYVVNRDAADLDVLVAETDAKINLKNFTSELTPALDQGQIPESVEESLTAAGISVDDQTMIKTVVPGQRWTFSAENNEYKLALEPQFWERQRDKNNDKIRFIKSLDYLWIYR